MNKLLLIILDGWGIGSRDKSNVIYSTPTPFIDGLNRNYPHTCLLACGEEVGLPKGQMGNSEVGHLNIGAGRVVYQDLMKINRAIKNRELWNNEVLKSAFSYASEHGRKVHFIGLIGEGGVHALSSHLHALCEMGCDMGVEKMYIHGLTDGRDSDPVSGLEFLKRDMEAVAPTGAKFVSIIGRYYGMDRDKNWDRIKIAYDLFRYGKGKAVSDLISGIEASYKAGITDEFIKPLTLTDDSGNPVGSIEEGDVVICFNYRTDRLRELTVAFTQKDFPEFGLETMPLYWCTMTNYSADFKGVHPVFEKENIRNTLGEVVANNGLKQIRIAETEKYAHVTFFFSGGREEPFQGESRILVPSPKVATYDLQPEMSAPVVTDKIVEQISRKSADFICLNYANGDMVGHTGVYTAIEKAVEVVDRCVERTVTAAVENGYEVLIIADHGNADYALNPDGSPNTAHSLNPVPCIWVTSRKCGLKPGILADVAPTILDIMGLEKPEEMTGRSLII